MVSSHSISPLVSVGERTFRGPDFLFHVLPPSAPHLDLGGSVQCSDVGLYLYLHLSSDEGSLWLVIGRRILINQH